MIPFNAVIEGNSDIKNYADYLYKKCGGAILSWIIEGARRVIAKDYRISQPRVVVEAIRRYKENNDWLAQFLEECCEVDPTYTAKSGEFYNEYRAYCAQVGEYIRSTTDFYTAIELAGFEKKRTKTGVIVRGIRLKSDFLKS